MKLAMIGLGKMGGNMATRLLRSNIEVVDEQGVAAPVLTLALQMRFASQEDEGYSYKLLSMMRNAFGGHHMKSS